MLNNCAGFSLFGLTASAAKNGHDSRLICKSLINFMPSYFAA